MTKDSNAAVCLKDQGERVALSGEINFDTAEAWVEIGTRYLHQSSLQCVCFDLSGIEYSNVAGLSVLLSWLRAARVVDRKLTYKCIPLSLTNMAEVCGVDEWIK